MKYILIQGNDFKTKEIGRKLREKDIRLIPIGSSPIKLPLYIILYLFKHGRPAAIIYRYLNDYPGFLKTFIRILSEIFGIIITKIFGVGIIWLCHNVDRESYMYYPLLTRFRRCILTKASKKILVTDPLLIKHAKSQFPRYKSKIDYITFGPHLNLYESKSSIEVISAIKKFVERHNSESKNMKYGFVAGNINWKTSQFSKIPQLIKMAEQNGHNLRFIVIGPIGSYLQKNNIRLFNELKEDNRILFLDGYYDLNLEHISKYIDFYWRVYLDFSTPATIYEAAYYKKPILTQKTGFLGEAVSAYSLGYIVNNDYSNLSTVLNDLSNWNPAGANKFLSTHSWAIAAKRIYKVSFS